MKYFIDGRKVADEKLIDTWTEFCSGKDPPYPNQLAKIVSGPNMVGDLSNINVYKNILSDMDMNLVMILAQTSWG